MTKASNRSTNPPGDLLAPPAFGRASRRQAYGEADDANGDDRAAARGDRAVGVGVERGEASDEGEGEPAGSSDGVGDGETTLGSSDGVRDGDATGDDVATASAEGEGPGASGTSRRGSAYPPSVLSGNGITGMPSVTASMKPCQIAAGVVPPYRPGTGLAPRASPTHTHVASCGT